MAVVFLGLGSNIDKERYILSGLRALADGFTYQQRSRIFLSEAVGFKGSDFYNLVVEVTTEQSVEKVLAHCKRIEQENGRKRESAKYSPRSLDIDVLLYDDLIREKAPQLPRHEITENAFVLWPLAEIAEDRRHPILQKTYGAMWRDYCQQPASAQQNLTPLENTAWLNEFA